MRLRRLLAVTAAKAALTACHLSGRPGSSLLGRAALKERQEEMEETLRRGVRQLAEETAG